MTNLLIEKAFHQKIKKNEAQMSVIKLLKLKISLPMPISPPFS